jgi:hypothetical protein
MSIITEREDAAGEYEEVGITAASTAAGWTLRRRRSARPSRRAVLHVHSVPDLSVPEDVVRWYTERGFHFYLAGPRPGGGRRRISPRLLGGIRPGRFGLLDAACRQLREGEGISSVLISAQSADAPGVALWCDARRDAEPADALILSDPDFGRRLRRGLHIACPVLVLSPAAPQRAGAAGTTLGPHVTWLGLASQERKLLFDELGRWLGAYMYGPVRDQLL